jgi:hypothetical protein
MTAGAAASPAAPLLATASGGAQAPQFAVASAVFANSLTLSGTTVVTPFELAALASALGEALGVPASGVNLTQSSGVGVSPVVLNATVTLVHQRHFPRLEGLAEMKKVFES